MTTAKEPIQIPIPYPAESRPVKPLHKSRNWQMPARVMGGTALLFAAFIAGNSIGRSTAPDPPARGVAAVTMPDPHTQAQRQIRNQMTQAENSLNVAEAAINRAKEISALDAATKSQISHDIELLRVKLRHLLNDL